jgi:tetratricopeptide (TPR) repeat protein
VVGVQYLLPALGGAAVLTIAIRLGMRFYPPTWQRLSSARQLVLFVVLTALFWVVTVFYGPGVTSLALTCAFVVLVPVTWGRVRRARAVEAALAALSNPESRARALADLNHLRGSAPAGTPQYRRWARLAMYIAQQASRADLPEQALAWGEEIDPARLDATALALRTQLIAACSIAVGQRARARAELGRVRRPAGDVLWERALQALETLLDALEGNVEKAEATARREGGLEKEPALRVTWLVAHAHALAALGRREEALDVLRKARDSMPEVKLLERVVRHAGPASALATSLLGDGASAYR